MLHVGVVFLLGAILTLTPGVATAQISATLNEDSRKIVNSILLERTATDSLAELTDTIGGRLAGSPAYNCAAEWAAAKFRSYGIHDVRLEPFTIPNGWQRGWAHGRIVAPIDRHLTIESVGWAPSTRSGGARGELIVVNDVSPAAIRARAGELRDRIVLLDHRRAFQQDEREALVQIRASYQLFAEVNASAVLLANDRLINNLLGGWVDNDNYHAAVLPIPVAEIGREDNYLLLRLLKRGPVKVEFEYQNQVTGPVTLNNVIAQIPGEYADQWVLVGAHLDSWDYGTGAQDDGTGVVMVLEAARALASLKRKPHRSIRFALFGAEEPGTLGSRAYVSAHSAELLKCVAMLNTDNGAGRPFGWRVFQPDLKEHLQPISTALLSNLGGDQLTEGVEFEGDDETFFLQGVPVLDLWVDMTHYAEIAHKQGDTFDKVDPLQFEAGAAIVAVTTEAIAEYPSTFAHHLTHEEIGSMLRSANLEKSLVDLGLWTP